MTSRERVKRISLLCLSLFSSVGYASVATSESNLIYHVQFTSTKSTCVLRINDIPAIDTHLARMGTMSAGFNFSAFLENGHNRIEVLMGPQDPNKSETLSRDSSCQVVISKDSIDKSIEIANFALSVVGDGDISARSSTNYNGSNNHTKILEGRTKNKNDYGLYKLESGLIISNLPKWSWVDATPVSEKDYPAVKLAYQEIISAFARRDIQSLKRVTQVSNEEMAAAEGTSPELIFASTGLAEHVLNKKLNLVPVGWNNYRIIPYRGGRLFRLGVGYYQNSPLRLKDEAGDIIFVYKPYFSMINGKVVLVR